jgi:hypothetical protein
MEKNKNIIECDNPIEMNSCFCAFIEKDLKIVFVEKKLTILREEEGCFLLSQSL